MFMVIEIEERKHGLGFEFIVGVNPKDLREKGLLKLKCDDFVSWFGQVTVEIC
jgi:hypothetical protein